MVVFLLGLLLMLGRFSVVESESAEAGITSQVKRLNAPAKVPGVVIDHSLASSGQFIGSPSLVVLTNGTYLASHDFFGPKSGYATCATTEVFRSTNGGTTWQKNATLKGCLWANLFIHRGAVYLIGVEKEYGRIVIRRSLDSGQTWTEPNTSSTGLLTSGGHFHTAPVPVVESAGRLWRAFEDADGGTEWGKRYRAGVLSVPVAVDLLNATNWTSSNFLRRDPKWLDGDFGGWLEGNVVVTPRGKLVDILRVDTSGLPEKAAMVEISDDGRTVAFDSASGFIDLPGAAKKFTIRKDPKFDGYWTLSSIVVGEKAKAEDNVVSSGRPGGVRNTLALLHSSDLREWEVRSILLHHPDVIRHGFQYVDWQFDGDDIIAVCRTAYDDGFGGAHNNHDANYLTFHRVKNFRNLTTAAVTEGEKMNP